VCGGVQQALWSAASAKSSHPRSLWKRAAVGHVHAPERRGPGLRNMRGSTELIVGRAGLGHCSIQNARNCLCRSWDGTCALLWSVTDKSTAVGAQTRS